MGPVALLCLCWAVAGAQTTFFFAGRSVGVVAPGVMCSSVGDKCNLTYALSLATALRAPAVVVVGKGSYILDPGIAVTAVAAPVTITGVGETSVRVPTNFLGCSF
jgi:hypothetical protein